MVTKNTRRLMLGFKWLGLNVNNAINNWQGEYAIVNCVDDVLNV